MFFTPCRLSSETKISTVVSKRRLKHIPCPRSTAHGLHILLVPRQGYMEIRGSVDSLKRGEDTRVADRVRCRYIDYLEVHFERTSTFVPP